MKKFLLYGIWVVLGLCLLLVMALGAGWLYVRSHKKTILREVSQIINRQIRADTHFDDVDLSFIPSFPNPSVRFSGVTVRDSTWTQDKRVLFKAAEVDATLPLWKLLRGQMALSKIKILQGAAYIYSDSTGYSSTAIFRRKAVAPRSKPFQLPDIDIRDSKLVVEKREKNKFFSFDIRQLICRVKHEANSEDLNINLSVHAEKMEFRRENGSFLENRLISGRFRAQFNPASKVLQFDQISLAIGKQPFVISGKFYLGVIPAPFFLQLETQRASFAEATALLTPSIQKSLHGYTVDGAMDISAVIDGTDQDRREPLIKVRANIPFAHVSTPFARFRSANFHGFFTNQLKADQERGDENSLLRFTGFQAVWENIRIHSDTITLTNLRKPFLTAEVDGFLDLRNLNHLTQDKDLELEKGSGKLWAVYKGPVDDSDSSNARKSINGTLELDSATLVYLPRNLRFSNASGRISLTGQDLKIERLKTAVGNTELQMKGTLRNIFALLGKPPQKPSFECLISSPNLRLTDFISFLHKKPAAGPPVLSASMPARTIAGIVNALNDNDAQVELKAARVQYRQFQAYNLHASVLLTGNEIKLHDVSLEQAGGRFSLSGSMTNEPLSNPFSLIVKMKNMDVQALFTSFANFGQKAVTSENLRGKLDAEVELSGAVTGSAALLPGSLKGNVTFNLNDGALIDFSPVQQIGGFIFKHKDLSDVRFAELKDNWEMEGTAIRVGRMQIKSTAIDLFVEGVYDLEKGTDMSLQVPLSNLKGMKKEELNIDPEPDTKPGASLHLRARTGKDGKLKISWDPFHKALKKSRKSAA